jgi:hypothetical protein
VLSTYELCCLGEVAINAIFPHAYSDRFHPGVAVSGKHGHRMYKNPGETYIALNVSNTTQSTVQKIILDYKDIAYTEGHVHISLPRRLWLLVPRVVAWSELSVYENGYHHRHREFEDETTELQINSYET